MTLIMAVYHFNIYPIGVDDFSSARDALKAFFSDVDPDFPYRYGDAFSSQELKIMLRSLPENITYMVRRSLDGHRNTMFSVWLLPTFIATSAIEHLINNQLISLDHCRRDVRFYDLNDAINDLPYNYHYIVQRYYE